MNIIKNIKQVILIRKDLNMRRGKECAQVAHASLAALLSISKKNKNELLIPLKNEYVEAWLNGSFTKITLQVNSESELLFYYSAFEEISKKYNNEFPLALICDSGKTEFNGVKTFTTLGIGPWDADVIDEITGNLKLY